MSTIRFKTFSGSFSRYCHEFLLFFFFGQTLLENEISIHKLCPQSGLKHSVGHFQGIAMNFYFFFGQTLLENEISIHIAMNFYFFFWSNFVGK